MVFLVATGHIALVVRPRRRHTELAPHTKLAWGPRAYCVVALGSKFASLVDLSVAYKSTLLMLCNVILITDTVVNLCVFVSVWVCGCGCEREREREREKGKRMVCVCMCMCIHVCVCVCVFVHVCLSVRHILSESLDVASCHLSHKDCSIPVYWFDLSQLFQSRLAQSTPESVHQHYEEMLSGVREKANYSSQQLVLAAQMADQSIR